MWPCVLAQEVGVWFNGMAGASTPGLKAGRGRNVIICKRQGKQRRFRGSGNRVKVGRG